MKYPKLFVFDNELCFLKENVLGDLNLLLFIIVLVAELMAEARFTLAWVMLQEAGITAKTVPTTAAAVLLLPLWFACWIMDQMDLQFSWGTETLSKNKRAVVGRRMTFCSHLRTREQLGLREAFGRLQTFQCPGV